MVSAANTRHEHPFEDIPDAVKGMIPITDYQQIKEILGSRDFALAGREHSRPFMMRTIVLLEDEEHAGRRRVEAPLFRPGLLSGQHQDMVNRAIDEMIAPLLDAAAGSSELKVDLVDLVMRIETLVMAEFVGVEMPEDRQTAVTDLVHRMQYINDAVSLVWSRKDPIDQAWEIRQQLVDFVGVYIMPAINRARDRDGSESTGTLIETLVESYDPATWDGELIAREAISYMSAGVQTSTNTILDALPLLMEWIEQHPESVVDALDTASDFLNRVVSESLRINVPNPAIFRVARRSGKTPGGLEYKEGQEFVMWTGIAHANRGVFGEDADEFNPYRSPAEGVPLWGFAFGHGHHACIGRSLALGRLSHDGEIQGYEGSTLSILRMLVKLGVRYDSSDKPEYRTDTFKVAFKKFPVILKADGISDP